jgi:hypothetical protein
MERRIKCGMWSKKPEAWFESQRETRVERKVEMVGRTERWVALKLKLWWFIVLLLLNLNSVVEIPCRIRRVFSFISTPTSQQFIIPWSTLVIPSPTNLPRCQNRPPIESKSPKRKWWLLWSDEKFRFCRFAFNAKTKKRLLRVGKIACAPSTPSNLINVSLTKFPAGIFGSRKLIKFRNGEDENWVFP